MAKIMIFTQVYENYGSAEKPYWKAKGGNEYVVPNFTDFNHLEGPITQIRDMVECDDRYYRETLVDWFIADDSYLTEFEKSQLEYDDGVTGTSHSWQVKRVT